MRTSNLDSAFAGMTIIICDLTMRALSEGARLETADIRTLQIVSGPDDCSQQPMGLAGVAIEAEAHWLRSQALPLSGTFAE